MVDYLEQEHITRDEMPTGVDLFAQNIADRLRNICIPIFREDGEIGSARIDWLTRSTRSKQSDRTYIELLGIVPSHITEQVYRDRPIKQSPQLTSSNEYLESSQRNLLLEGTIDNTYTLCVRANIQITDNEPGIVKVSGYDIKDTLANLGVTQAFYNELDNLLGELAFQAVFGINNDQNISFFLNKLGRKRLANVPRSLQKKIWNALGTRIDSEFITVKTL